MSAWECPYCNRSATIGENDRGFNSTKVSQRQTNEGWVSFRLEWIICPAKDCQKLSLDFIKYISSTEFNYNQGIGYYTKNMARAHSQKLFPRGHAKLLPDYVPTSIVQDYEEACLIINDSPRAAATLYRRCLQGMIRDFWGITEKTLYLEIEKSIKQHPETEDFLHPIRELGNIGAHPEKDINLIVSIEPEEANLMKETIEHLIDEWYVTREKTKHRKAALKQIVDDKNHSKAKLVTP